MFHEGLLRPAAKLMTVVETSNKTFMRDVTTIERDWLTELAYVPWRVSRLMTQASLLRDHRKETLS